MGEYQERTRRGTPTGKKENEIKTTKSVNHAFDRSKNSCHKISAAAPPPKSSHNGAGLAAAVKHANFPPAHKSN